MTPGSSGSEKVINMYKKEIHTTKNLWFSTCSKEEFDSLFVPRHAYAIALKKKETYKVRPFINTDLRLHALLSLVYHAWVNVIGSSDNLYPVMGDK